MSDIDYEYAHGVAQGEIAQQRARIAELEAENAAWNEKWKRSVESHQAASSRAETAERELAEARELLGTAAELCHGNDERRELTARIDAFLAKEQA